MSMIPTEALSNVNGGGTNMSDAAGERSVFVFHCSKKQIFVLSGFLASNATDIIPHRPKATLIEEKESKGLVRKF